jgi:hypothetical protein
MTVTQIEELIARRPGFAATVAFWEANAPWYSLWLAHNHYHDPICEVLDLFVRPLWNVLDVGGGSGVLSFFLRGRGCHPVLLEPTAAMRTLFDRRAAASGGSDIPVDPRTWEDLPVETLRFFDLVLACNSFPVTRLGLQPSILKAAAAGVAHLFVVAEEPGGAGLRGIEIPGYEIALTEDVEVESSYAYHSLDQAFGHAAFKSGRPLAAAEIDNLAARLVFEDGHYWYRDTALVRMCLWSKTADGRAEMGAER